MKKYISVDNNIRATFKSVLIALFVPFYGPYYMGTRFTSMYADTRLSGGIVAILCFVIHVVLFQVVILQYVIS